MKRFLYLTVVLLFAAMSVQATNDYLEQKEHYTVMNMGNGVYRFYVPIWVYGFWNNYYLNSSSDLNDVNDSYVWYSLKKDATRGSEDVHRIATVWATRVGKNKENDYRGEGEGFIFIHEGSAVIQSMFSGEKLAIQAHDTTYYRTDNPLSLKRKNDDGHEDITFFTFDWYVPQDLVGKDFYFGVSANIYGYNDGSSHYKKWWPNNEKQNVSYPQTPELFTPYLYAVDGDGATGYGNAAVQYTVFQDPVSYHTSLNPKEMPCDKRSDMLIVPTTDTVQRFFSATFVVDMVQDSALQRYTVKSNEIHIPAYHRIYDFRAEEILDAQQSVTGDVQLSWGIRCPGAQDLVATDMFEVERAFKADFSDAVTIAIENFNADSGTYRIPDNPLEAMRALYDTTLSIASNISESGTFTVTNADGDIVEYEATLSSNKIYEPGRPIYYRIRRATSAIWGWIEGFSQSIVLNKNNYLAPLAAEQAPYEKDADYETNRKVHFNVKIDNQAIQLEPEAEEQCVLQTKVKNIHRFVPITLRFRGTGGVNLKKYNYKFFYLPPEGAMQSSYLPMQSDGTIQAYAESGGKAQVSVIDRYDGMTISVYVVDLIGKFDDKAAYIADVELYPSGDGINLRANVTEDEAAMQAAYEDFIAENPLPDTVKHSLYTQLSHKVTKLNASDTRCNWDRNAVIYLQRIMVETGDTIELPVPADSIIRQADGSWMAHMTDVAGMSCMHYKYAVRIDQRASALKVLHSGDLKPIAIDGPDLYYNEVADIARFEASRGTDRYGIILTWEQTPGGVDNYELARREAGSTDDYKVLLTTTKNDFRDDSVAPGVNYEYRIIASYTCNDTTTTHDATTTGSRSPYGLIAGRIHYADGIGCAGIKVRLESEGMSDLETVTDGAGRYVFDSLLYGEGKNYSIIPTSTYAEFRFNNTSMPTASITLDAGNPVASEIEFDNISSVRFSGRILYSMSSIPVRDANILLDGVMIERAGGPLKTDALGNFEIQVPKNHQFTLQAVKDGHTFEGDGFVRMNNDSNLVLDKALDGVRIWDATKVRLAGRIVGGLEQSGRALGFGLSVNNLGDDLQLVLELEGDNISHIVRDENDLTRDTLEYAVPHVVYGGAEGQTDTVGTTQMHYQKKRIIINPDPLTGEYCADLFPVRYKITQATARGYATLFAEGKTSEVIDLSNAATVEKGDILDGKAARWNEKYCITYRAPIDITCTQLRYGVAEPYLGERSMTRQNIMNENVEIPLVEKDSNGVWQYTFGHPVFATGDYTFRINAYEDYYYNNDKTSTKHERVPINGGDMKIYNGLHASEETQTLSSLFPKWEQATQHLLGHGLGAKLNEAGQIDVTVPVDYVSFNKTGDQALRVLDVSIELDGRHIEKQIINAYVTGNRFKGNDYAMAVDGGVHLLDILRDPPGANSYAYLESGTSYTYNYNWTLNLKFGVNLNWAYGTGVDLFIGNYIGTVAGAPGVFSGNTYSSTITNGFSLPLTMSMTWKHGGSYTFTTNERIETASDNWFVGSRGDIYLGVTQGVVFQLLDAVKPLDSLTYVSLATQLKDSVGVTGSSATVAEGRGLDGQKYYLVLGEEVGSGAHVNGSFAYSQDYILTVLLPQLIEQRDALLVTGDSATVQAIADAKQEPVYWSHVLPTDTTFALTNYTPVYPTGQTPWMVVDRVEEYNKAILNWMNLIAKNEKEKATVMAGVNADSVKTYFVSNGVKLSYSETYNAVENHAFIMDGFGINPTSLLTTKSIANSIQGISSAALNALERITTHVEQDGQNKTGGVNPTEVRARVPGADYIWNINPILNVNYDRDPNWSETRSRTAGFVLEPDEYSYMNVSVLRWKDEDHHFNQSTYDVRETVDDGNDYDGYSHLYGSFIYKLNGGASKCPWEGPEESIFYEQGGRPAQLSNGTLKLENPKIDIIHHEISDVPRDQPAIVKIRLSNETQQSFENYVVFKLVLVDASNPNGAKVLMDGFPLTGDGRAIKLNPGQTIDKTLEVYAGEGYDFENLTLMLASQCDILNFMKASFSVHFIPTSCDVHIATPHDKWVMNTLSPKDSTGWYLPVVIDGYDIQYPNFDHIEFQYKLSKQSDDGWVNLCSYYADSAYYEAASGSKAMMRAGRIENIAFYGERDPMEQQYDLRAVSFCRYGTSYITKSSPVLTGIKDTRVPVVFGEPEPANSILGVGDHLKLRFNEPIAGNYLDEDNNFQITGITNTIGLSASTALHFDGNSSATTKAKRDLTETDFTIDMMIKPTVANNRANDMILFETGDGQMTKQLILTKDNYLRLIKTNGKNFLGKSSKKLEDIRALTRVVCVYTKGGKVRFYLGTEDVTSNNLGSTEDTQSAQDRSAYFRFGSTYEGDMLETRIWTKALTLEEISATANRYLTGYERELLAYYRMDEGKGETVTDHAHGATLYLDGCSWNKQKGYSLRLDGKAVKLNGNLLGRSKTYDMTMMLWFKAETDGMLFNSADLQLNVPEGYADGNWHHLVLTVSRTYNNAALFLDGKIIQTYDATQVGGLTGAMYLGGNGFKGNIDEFVIFEQALPKQLVELYEANALTGDEMGLFAYLPFEEQYTNPNSIIELRFSINDQRVFKDANGKVVKKVVPLVIDQPNLADITDAVNNAPVKSNGVLNKLFFNWAFNDDELLVNILNQDYEVNKQSIYITVRDVEDLNGNPMASPVTWTAFVDRNSLKWSEKQLVITCQDNADTDPESLIRIVNNSGKRHQYTIESLPSWLTVDKEYGAIDPMGEQQVWLTFNSQTAVGEYSDIIYLTDENGLSEPLQIEYTVQATPPYGEPDEHAHPYNMSVCAQVVITDDQTNVIDSDDRDLVYAFYRNECVGMGHVSFDNVANKSKVYLTVFGNEEMNGKPVHFRLWQASTGKLFELSANVNVLFSQGYVYNCGDDNPLVLTTSGSETQTVELSAGWNWVSFYLDLRQYVAKMQKIMTVSEPWTEGDLIKNPATRHFVIYSDSLDRFVGDFDYLRYIYTYMVYCADGNTIHIAGDPLPEDSMYVTLNGDGQWSPLPCLFDKTTPLSEALADYYQNATPGDLIKARNRFATFTGDKRWEGNLTALRPGEGYFFRRMGAGTANIAFHPQANAVQQRKQAASASGLTSEDGLFTNPAAATNMTMIARLDTYPSRLANANIRVFVGDELAAVATPITNHEVRYFITIQSDRTGELRFETEDGTPLVSETPLCYAADSHHGTTEKPVILKPGDPDRVRKIIENDHVVIIRNGEKYDVTGKKL